MCVLMSIPKERDREFSDGVYIIVLRHLSPVPGCVYPLCDAEQSQVRRGVSVEDCRAACKTRHPLEVARPEGLSFPPPSREFRRPPRLTEQRR